MNLLLMVVPSGMGGRIDESIYGESRELKWKLARDQWQEVLYMLRGLVPKSHQYFDCPNMTVFVSLMENLQAS